MNDFAIRFLSTLTGTALYFVGQASFIRSFDR